MIPILAFVGAAVDFSRANAVKAKMQTALNSAALLVSHNATSLNSTELQTEAQKYFIALFDTPSAKDVTVTATYSKDAGSAVVLNGSATVDTEFMSFLGYKSITVTGSSTTKWGLTRLRVALVLDNTGSMADDGKMTALKTATKNLIAQLQGAASQDGDVYVSVIPFSKDVNAGSSNYSSSWDSWIDWTQWDSANRTCNGWLWNNYCFGNWVAASHSTWNGCVMDRGDTSGPNSQNYDQNVLTPQSTVAASKYPAEQYSSCPKAARGLNNDWTTMTSYIDQMSPNGSTNQPIGLVWGWLSLVGGGPFTAPAMDPNYKYQQVIILLSDGLNTQDRWYGNGYNTSTQVDGRMYNSSNSSGTCANIHKAGITVYTIQVNTGGDPTSTLLKNCASSPDAFPDPSKFFLLTSADQIVTTFDAIGTNLTKLRVAE